MTLDHQPEQTLALRIDWFDCSPLTKKQFRERFLALAVMCHRCSPFAGSNRGPRVRTAASCARIANPEIKGRHTVMEKVQRRLYALLGPVDEEFLTEC